MSKPGPIKISLGGKKPSTAAKPGAKAPVTTIKGKSGAPKRSNKFSFGGADEEDHEDEGAAVEVTHFDQAKGGAHHAHAKPSTTTTQERVIDCAPNRNWRDEATKKRQKSALPGHNQGSRGAGGELEGGMAAGNMKYGLNVKPNSKPAHRKTFSVITDVSDRSLTGATAEDEDGEHVPSVDEDQLKRQPTKTNIDAVFDEERIYEDDVEKAPDAPSLGDYEKVPVEGFGLAMLRGMGFKEDGGKKEEKKKKGGGAVPRRPALLGIGAKPLEEDKKK